MSKGYPVADTKTKTETIDLSFGEKAKDLDEYSIAFEVGDNENGTITCTALHYGNTTYEPLTRNGAPLVINLADANEPKTRKLKGYQVTDFKFVPAGFDGADDWAATVIGKE